MTEKDENFKHESLYDTINDLYSTKNPISRILYITKLKEVQVKDEKITREATLGGIKKEITNILKQNESKFNIMIIYIGTVYALISVEDQSENLTEFLIKLKQEIKSGKSLHSSVNILSFVEDCPSSLYPAWYKNEAGVYNQESQLYKGKPVIEKGWVLYENLFCNLGRTIKALVPTEEDFAKNELKIKKEEVNFVKYIPSMDEINEFMGPNFISLDNFLALYVDSIDVDLDEDSIWPYHWPINV